MSFRFFTPAEWAALPAASKREEYRSQVLAGKEVTRKVKLFVEASGKEVLAIVTDNPPIVEQRG